MKVSAETNAAQQALNQLSEKLDSLGPSKMQQIAAGVAVVTSAFRAAKTVIGTVVNVSKELIDTYRVQEQAEARLQAVLKATGSQVGITASDMLELASAVQSYTRFGDEAVIEAEKLLLATQSLDKDGLERAIAASADLAEALGIDIVSAASTMAYALQDPEQGLTRLRRQGIAFTDEEYEQVKALQEANDLYGAQAVVLEKIESRYKGVSKAVADTPTGTLDKIKNVWGDIKENLGEGIVRALSPAFDWLLKQLNKVSEWTKDKNDKANFNSLLSSGSYEQLGQSFSGEYLREQERIILEDYYDSLGQLRRSELGQILSRGSSYSLDEIVRKDSNEINKILNDALTSIYGEGDFSYAIRGYADAIENFKKNQISALDTIEKAISYSDQQKNANINTFADFVPGSALSGDAPVAGVAETSAIDSFLKQYGRSSLSYQASEYQKIIDQAKELRDQMYQPIV
ncbi:MAG: phage tail length tape measure family protein, partial [Spirochaetales bacterium]|nr:phage tail length tape measure family protein [Spirochaetales bacterium]